jgi:HEAT repeat protein
MEPAIRVFAKIAPILLLGVALTHPGPDEGHRALYLMQKNQVEESLQLYRDNYDLTGRQNFEVLQQMGLLLLKKGIQSEDPQVFLMTLFGAGLSGSASALEILEKGVAHADPYIQLLSLHFVSQFDDDRTFDIFNRAMSSDFLSTRMEAAFAMAQRKHPQAVGQIEGLMCRLPPAFKPYFPSFFALLGTSEATYALRRLIEDIDPQVRIESILNVARTGRDDFLPMLRKRLSHSHIAEVEAAIYAVGLLKDSASVPRLKKLASSPTDSIRLAAALALWQLGDRSGKATIEELAKQNHLFSIAALGELVDTEELLTTFLSSSDLQIRTNAGIALLRLRDPRSIPVLEEVLIEDSRVLAFYPFGSPGRTQTVWRTVPSADIRQNDPTVDMNLTLAIREHLLRESIHLPEESFLKLARTLFTKGQNALIPTLVSLLENLRTDGAIALLKEAAEKPKSPLIRDYCHLALFRLKEEGPYEEYITHWISKQRSSELIRLRPLLPWKYRMEQTDYTLSAEETSRLLVDAFLALANRRDERSVSFLLEAIQFGNPENRYALMGILMRATE